MNRPDGSGRHVVIVGMHRSGTSAVANVVAQLGLELPDETDLITPGPHNQRGYWELRRFVTFNGRVLQALGGTWSAPPITHPGWELADDPVFRQLRADARQFAAHEFGARSMVLKDPRLCLTLPLWRDVFDVAPVGVLALRDPLEVAQSLQERNDYPLTLGLALWRRYVQHSLTSVEGLPAFALEYGELLRDPATQVSGLASFFSEHGLPVETDQVDDAVAALEPDLRHHRDAGAPEEQRVLVRECREFFEAILAQRGPNAPWVTPSVPREPEWVGDVLRLDAAGEMVTFSLRATERELKWIKRSRLFEVTRALWRVTSTGPDLAPDAPGPASMSNGGHDETRATGGAPRPRIGRWAAKGTRVLQRARPASATGPFQQEDNPVAPHTLKDFRFCAVIKSWMDEDIIAASVQNAFVHGADSVYLVDNASRDATVPNAVAAGAIVAEVYESEGFDGRLVQPLVNAVVARESLKSGANHVWWMLLDSDEFPEGPGGMSVRSHLAGLDRRFRVVGASFVNHVPDGKPEYVPGFHPIDFQPLYYAFEPANNPPCPLGHWKHPLQRFDRNGQFVLSNEGAHLAFASELLVEPTQGIVVHHFQYRDEDVTRAKMDLVCGPRSTRVRTHEKAGFSGFARRRRSLDAVYRQDWDAVDTLPNGRTDGMTLQRWRDIDSVRRWYEVDALEEAQVGAAPEGQT